MAREGAPLIVIQRQLGHANLGVTSQTRVPIHPSTAR
jgi:integrase